MATQLFEKTKHIHAVGPRALSKRQIDNQVRFLFIGKGLAAAASAVALSFGLASTFDTSRGVPDTSGQLGQVILATHQVEGLPTTEHAYVAAGGQVERVVIANKTYNECVQAMRNGCNKFVVDKTTTGVLIAPPSNTFSENASGLPTPRQNLSEWRAKHPEAPKTDSKANDRASGAVYSRIE